MTARSIFAGWLSMRIHLIALFPLAGEQNGYNIPEVISFPDLKWWLSDDGTNYLLTIKDDKLLPEMPRRLLCDAYMCLYQSPDVNIYS